MAGRARPCRGAGGRLPAEEWKEPAAAALTARLPGLSLESRAGGRCVCVWRLFAVGLSVCEMVALLVSEREDWLGSMSLCVLLASLPFQRVVTSEGA